MKKPDAAHLLDTLAALSHQTGFGWVLLRGRAPLPPLAAAGLLGQRGLSPLIPSTVHRGLCSGRDGRPASWNVPRRGLKPAAPPYFPERPPHPHPAPALSTPSLCARRRVRRGSLLGRNKGGAARSRAAGDIRPSRLPRLARNSHTRATRTVPGGVSGAAHIWRTSPPGRGRSHRKQRRQRRRPRRPPIVPSRRHSAVTMPVARQRSPSDQHHHRRYERPPAVLGVMRRSQRRDRGDGPYTEVGCRRAVLRPFDDIHRVPRISTTISTADRKPGSSAAGGQRLAHIWYSTDVVGGLKSGRRAAAAGCARRSAHACRQEDRHGTSQIASRSTMPKKLRAYRSWCCTLQAAMYSSVNSTVKNHSATSKPCDSAGSSPAPVGNHHGHATQDGGRHLVEDGRRVSPIRNHLVQPAPPGFRRLAEVRFVAGDHARRLTVGCGSRSSRSPRGRPPR